MIEYENLKIANHVFEEDFKRAFDEFLQKGSYILGKKLSTFETAFSNFCNTRYSVGVGSGMDALKLALESCALIPGDEVLVPANTFIATILAVLHCGLKPVLVEPSAQTYNIDCSKIEELITSRTRAIIPVHLYGKMAEMDKVMALSDKYNLAVTEDCAQAHGAMLHGRKAGSWGQLGAFSFYPVKNLGALGDGGAIVTSSLEKAVLLKKLRNYGSIEKYNHEIMGYNSRLDELQAAFLLVKLKKLTEMNEHKRSLARIYFNQLKQDYILPVQCENYYDVFHLFPVRHEKRDSLKTYLLSKNIKTNIHYPIPLYRQKALKEVFGNRQYPVSDNIHDTILSLPISFGHTVQDIEYVCEVLNRF